MNVVWYVIINRKNTQLIKSRQLIYLRSCLCSFFFPFFNSSTQLISLCERSMSVFISDESTQMNVFVEIDKGRLQNKEKRESRVSNLTIAHADYQKCKLQWNIYCS